ncbi:hypothetical protein JNJ66_00155 [Candidatus Saccharibacteria bacterium]|nr:hypothetical protein [Candidatus Saccharibacteria bacterium]
MPFGTLNKELTGVTLTINEPFADQERTDAAHALRLLCLELRGGGLVESFTSPDFDDDDHVNQVIDACRLHLAVLQRRVTNFTWAVGVIERLAERSLAYHTGRAEQPTATVEIPLAEVQVLRGLRDDYASFVELLALRRPRRRGLQQFARHIAYRLNPEYWREQGARMPRDVMAPAGLVTWTFLQELSRHGSEPEG